MRRIIRAPLTKLGPVSTATIPGLNSQTRRLNSTPPAPLKLACLNSEPAQTPKNTKLQVVRTLLTSTWRRPRESTKTDAKGALQSVRTYAEANALSYDCWFCDDETPKKNGVLCQRCGHIQDVRSRIDYFALLEMPRTFSIDTQTLSQNFRHLQSLVHPDKFTLRSRREQDNSAEWSSMLNLAYRTLAAPFQRAQYMLKMYGYDVPEDNSDLDKEFLMEMMEKNEEVEEAETVEQLQALLDKVTAHLNNSYAELTKQFDNKELETACNTLTSMRYYISLQSTIKAKMEQLAERAQ